MIKFRWIEDMKQIENRLWYVLSSYISLCILFVFTSCGGGGDTSSISDEEDSDGIEPKEFYEGMMEQFCLTYYDDLYHDFWGTRKYIPGSMRVDSISPCGVREVMIYGKHDFEGRVGNLHRGYKFSANVYESKKGSHDYIVTFEKESKKIISGKSYTESRTKTLHYE